mmetsp:Transcript_4835/g.7474  ORF Transcript_4835/g.7474 Transcript_4835/m.7474 type:complete len:101 (+) Transcript_4835:772-1074(+)
MPGHLQEPHQHLHRYGKDPNCSTSHWLLLFPKEMPLDNAVFSDEPDEVQIHKVPMKIERKTQSIPGLVVYWRIAEKHGRRRMEAKTKKDTLDDLFADMKV